MTNCCPSFLQMARRESRAQTVLHAALVMLWALMLLLMLASSAYALSDSNAEMRELALAGKGTQVESVQACAAQTPTKEDKGTQARPVKAAARKGAAHG